MRAAESAIDPCQQLVQSLRTAQRRDTFEPCAHRLVAAGPREESAGQRPVVEAGAADEDRLLAARRDVANDGRGVACVVRSGVLLRRIRDVHHVMRNALLLGERNLVGADVEHPVDGGRIAGDDLAVEVPGERNAQRALARGGGTDDRDESRTLHVRARDRGRAP